jgi:membrane protease subunit HflK
MSDEHDHHDHAHGPAATPPVMPDDAGSQALAEALRSSFAIVKFVMVALVIVFLGSGFFQVRPQEQAVILRFGRPVGAGQSALLGPGLHWSFPYPIDEVVRIPIKELQSVTSTVGWYYMTPEQWGAYKLTGAVPGASGTLNPAVDGYVITADRNIIHVAATLYYQVDDPLNYVFNFVSASNLVQNALNNAILYSAAHFGVDDVLYSDVAGFQDAVQQRAEQLAEQEQLGITVKQCTVDKTPPRQLKDIFDQVTEAQQNQNKVLNDAHTYENGRTNAAAAQAAAIVNEAQSARARYVQFVQADAKSFSVLLTNYNVNPSLFKQQQVMQVVGEALTNANFEAYVPTSANGEPVELRLMLNREPPGQNTATPAP